MWKLSVYQEYFNIFNYNHEYFNILNYNQQYFNIFNYNQEYFNILNYNQEYFRSTAEEEFSNCQGFQFPKRKHATNSFFFKIQIVNFELFSSFLKNVVNIFIDEGIR